MAITEYYFPEFFRHLIDFDSKHMLKSKLYMANNRTGNSGYIDYKSNNDFDNNNTAILYGRDRLNRFYISVRYTENGKQEKYITTFFQKYTQSKTLYRSCGETFDHTQIESHCFKNGDNFKHQFQILFNLLNTGTAKWNNNIYCLAEDE